MTRKGKSKSSHGFAYPQPTPEDIEISLRTFHDPKVRAIFKRDWKEEWADFLKIPGNKSWWERHAKKGHPIYKLPDELISELGMNKTPNRTTARTRTGARTRVLANPPLLSSEEVRAERSFTALCQKHSPRCVGIWNKLPVLHDLLGPATELDSFPDWMIMEASFLQGSLVQRKATLRTLKPVAMEARRTLLYRAGQLFCTNKFIRELTGLKRSWTKLRSAISLPLNRQALTPVHANGSPSWGVHDDTAGTFCKDARQFFDRWELLELTTWDLATPLGPLSMMPVKVSLNGLGDVKIGSIYPNYWPTTARSESLIARIHLPVEHGLGPIQEQVKPKASRYERAYEMRIAELAFISRYGKKRGYVVRLEAAFRKRLSLSAGRVKQIRAEYFPNLV